MKTMSVAAKTYIFAICVSGLAIIAYALTHWRSEDPYRFVCYYLIAAFASRLKVPLPGVTGTMSVNFVFILIGVLKLSFPETILLGCSAGLLQCVWRPKRMPNIYQVMFSFTGLAIAIAAGYHSYHALAAASNPHPLPLPLAISASVFFLVNTLPVAVVISLTEGKSIRKIWQDCYFWTFPYYLIGAAIAAVFSFFSIPRLDSLTDSKDFFNQIAFLVLVLPVVYSIYRYFRLYLGRFEAEKKHAEEVASLHLRTIESLAMAIDAKDHTTHDHLRRVQVYAMAIGGDLGLSSEELEALRAASLLHDIGKLAVPEHIISKPGRLTPEEFEKMKIHPMVGAEILEHVQFPYPVVPIVRAHHEKWDGTGYPEGLKGEEIPIGARILAAVDCLDALASDRQYRRALPLGEAMKQVFSEAGSSFDPKVVEILQCRYVELERQAESQRVEMKPLSKNVRVEKGLAPAAGFETPSSPASDRPDFLSSIAAARQEVQSLFELTSDLGNSLSLNETLSFLDVRLKRIIPYDSIAIYVQRNNRMVPEFVNGEDFRLFLSLEIPLGEGVSGWVAENHKPVLNGNPAVEPGYLNDPARFSLLRSALAVPLEGPNGLVGVLTLYHKERDAFSRDHLRVLQAIGYKLAMSIENAFKYQQAERSATTDGLTGLPNARSLFLHLDSELARCKRSNTPLMVLVCDLDGFKQVNDRFGHLEGNRVLQSVAKGLRDSCRAYDYVARMGGDEFVLVLPGQKLEYIRQKADRLGDMVAGVGRQVCGDDSLSLSVGSACWPQDGDDAEQLLAEADRRMYQVKQRNKGLLHEDLRVLANSLPIQ